MTSGALLLAGLFTAFGGKEGFHQSSWKVCSISGFILDLLDLLVDSSDYYWIYWNESHFLLDLLY